MLQENKKVVKAAVSQNGLALQYASMGLQDDVTTALVACRQNGLALQYVSKRLTNNKDVVLAAVRRNGMALKYASAQMKNETEVVTAATLRDSQAVQFLGTDYTSGKKKLVVSRFNVDGVADEITKKVMADASRDWSEEREDKQVDTRALGDVITDDRTPKANDCGYSFSCNMTPKPPVCEFGFGEKINGFKEYFLQNLPKLRKEEKEVKEVTSFPVRIEVNEVTVDDEMEMIQETREADVQVEAKNANVAPKDEKKEGDAEVKTFSFFQNMGKYLDESCQAGVELGHSTTECIGGTCQNGADNAIQSLPELPAFQLPGALCQASPTKEDVTSQVENDIVDSNEEAKKEGNENANIAVDDTSVKTEPNN